MKEYNWRKEREKYQPDFNKRPQEAAPVQPAPARVIPWGKIAGLFVAVAVVAAVVYGIVSSGKTGMPENSRTEPPAAGSPSAVNGDSALALANIAETHKTAVGLVVCNVELQDGGFLVVPIGTAWAISENQFVTNAHVAMSVKETPQRILKAIASEAVQNVLKENGVENLDELKAKIGEKAFQQLQEKLNKMISEAISSFRASVMINGGGGKSFDVAEVQVHSKYGEKNTSFDPDLAILTIQGKHDCHFNIANSEKLGHLKSGIPVAFLGFPMENLSNKNVNTANPLASMQTGIVVAVSDFEFRDAGASGNVLIRHNLPSTGGASGSPVFTADGDVVGVLYACNMIGQVVQNENGSSVQRAPSGALINFAIRTDLLGGMGSPKSFVDFMTE